MSRKTKARAEITAGLAPGEYMQHFTPAQYKAPGRAKQVGGELAVNLAVGTAMTVLTGGAMMSVSTAPAVWAAATNKRLLVFVHPQKGRRTVGDLVLDAPRGALRAELRKGLLSSVALVDAQTGEDVLSLNVGLGNQRRSAFIDAVSGVVKPAARQFVI